MSEKTAHIDVCIAAYKRPQLLAKLLACLAVQDLPHGVTFSVNVVDNDPHGSAREPVESAIAGGLRAQYFMQPEKNISLTRNMSVANAKGDYIAFIDDDEYTHTEWLKNMYQTLQAYSADVVFGPVLGQLPELAPSWLAEGNFFNRERYKTGTVCPVRGTGNVLMRADAMSDRRAPFNPKYGLTGGEDTDFFKRLQDNGKKFIWCDEAVVMETVQPDRQNAKWLIKRAFLGGRTFAQIYVAPKPAVNKIPWFFFRSILAAGAFVAGLLSWPLRKAWGVACFQKVASNVGQLSSLFRARFVER